MVQVHVDLGTGSLNATAAALIAAARDTVRARRRNRRLAQSDEDIEVRVEQTSAVSVVSALSDADTTANLQAALCADSDTTELRCSATGSGMFYSLSRTLSGSATLTAPVIDRSVLSSSITQINVKGTSTVVVVVRMPSL